MPKRFAIPADQIKPLVKGGGACIASDRITVDGRRVGYMYREADAETSGWTFFAGDESEEYCDNPGNFEIYNVNTIANYDPDIIPLLNSPVGSRFIRKNGGPLSEDTGL